MRRAMVGIALVWLVCAVCFKPVLADGGVVRLSRREGSYQVSVFTRPTPFRAGPVDISVLVQDAVMGQPVPDVHATVCLTAGKRPDQTIQFAATTEAATNKLLRSAIFELPEPGQWEVRLIIEGPSGFAQVAFPLEAGPRTPQWPAIWPWIVWPVPVVLLFLIHQRLVNRKSTGRHDRICTHLQFGQDR